MGGLAASQIFDCEKFVTNPHLTARWYHCDTPVFPSCASGYPRAKIHGLMKRSILFAAVFAVSAAFAADPTEVSIFTMSEHTAASRARGVEPPPIKLPLDINADGELSKDGRKPLQLHLLYSPATADVSKQTWKSSNEKVLTVDNEGFVTLVGVGEAEVTVSVGSAVSVPCPFVVEPSENRSMENRNLRSVPYIMRTSGKPVTEGVKDRIDKEAFLRWPSEYGETVIALWADDRQGAFSMTADDGHVADFWRWMAITEKWGGRMTLVITPGLGVDFASKDLKDKKGNTIGDWVRAGHEIQSHSFRHYDCDRMGFTSIDWLYDLRTSRDWVQDVLEANGVADISTSQTFTAAQVNYPAEFVSRFYTAARNNRSLYGGGNGTTKASPDDYSQLWALSTFISNGVFLDDPAEGTKPESTFEGLMRPLIDRGYGSNYGGILTVLTHQIWDAVVMDVQGLQPRLHFAEVLSWIYENYLYPNRHLLWYDTFTKMTCYAQERDASEIVAKSVKLDRIEFELTNYLDKELFKVPLTVKVKLDKSWDKLTVTQDGKPVEGKLLGRDGEIFAMVNVVPDRGKVVLAKTGEVKKLSSNAALAKLEYRIDAGRYYAETPETMREYAHSDNPRLDVPNFASGTTDYKVTLPIGTKKVAVFGTPADEAAIVTRDPLLGVLAVSNEKPVIATLTVTAEDGNFHKYMVTFEVEGYKPIESIKLAAANYKGEEANLKQETTSEVVRFTAWAQPEGQYDPTSIAWFVNGEAQEAKGSAFDFTPTKYGTYEIHAQAGSVQSEKMTVTFAKAAPVAINILWQDDFEKYTLGQPIPLTTDPDPSVQMWADRSVSAAGFTRMDPKTTHDLKVGQLNDHGKVAQWTADAPTHSGFLAKVIPNNKRPLVISAKVRVDGTEINSQAPPFNLGMSNLHGYFNGHFGLVGNNFQFTNWQSGWAFGKWMNFIYVIDPYTRDINNNYLTHVYVGNEHVANDRAASPEYEGGFQAWTSFGARANFDAIWENPQRTSHGVGFMLGGSFGGGKDGLQNIGKYSSYLDDVKIYNPGSFVMMPAKPAFAAGEPVRINFSHQADLRTLKANRVTVKNSAGAAVAFESIRTDVLNNDHFILNFTPGTLKSGTYTVELSELVRDVLDKTVYDVVTFKVN